MLSNPIIKFNNDVGTIKAQNWFGEKFVCQ